MPIHVWGTDFRRSSSSLRSRLHISVENRSQILSELLELGFQDLLYIHTCNRVEFYTTARDHFSDTQSLWKQLLESLNLPSDSFYQGYHLEGKSAVRHLVRVASSLESMVVGEPQILGQLKEALSWTQEHRVPISPPLNRALQMAFQSAKKVRSETSIGENSISVAALGMQRVVQLESELALSQAVLVGTSPIILLIRRWLEKNRPDVPILWVNRNPDKLRKLAESKGAKIMALPDFLRAPVPFSHFFTATSSAQALFGDTFFKHLNDSRCLLFDFAHPTDIDPASVPANSKLIGLEDLSHEAKNNEAQRRAAISKATKLIEDALREFYLEQKETPLLRDFSYVTPQIESSLNNAVEQLGNLVEEESLPKLKKWAASLVKKNLHQSREHLRTILRKAAHQNQSSSPM